MEASQLPKLPSRESGLFISSVTGCIPGWVGVFHHSIARHDMGRKSLSYDTWYDRDQLAGLLNVAQCAVWRNRSVCKNVLGLGSGEGHEGVKKLIWGS